MKNYITLLLVFCFLLGCGREEIKQGLIVDINIEDKSTVNLPQLSYNSVNLLETSDSTLFGNISSIEYFDNRFYLLDIFTTKSLIEFSSDGKYINRTTFGRGPEEMINPYAFFVDKDNEEILVWDQTLSSMFRYDLDLNYLSQTKYDIFVQNFSILDKKALVQTQFYKDYIYKLYSDDFELVVGNFIKDVTYSGVYGLLRSISINKRILMIAPLDYNIYQLKNNSIESVYYFNFGDYNLKPKEISNDDNIFKLFNSGQRVSSPYEIAESDNFLLFHVYFNNNTIFYAYYFDDGKTLKLNKYFDIDVLPKCNIRGVTDEGLIYALVEPKDLKEFQERTGKIIYEGQIDYTQNPFLLTFSISI